VSAGEGERSAGVVIGKVTRIRDDKGLGRIEVEYPWLAEGRPVERMVSVAAPMAGPDAGIFFMPAVGDEVVVGFDQGQWDHPIVIGYLWNPRQRPPSGDERQRMIRSKNGHTIRFVDSTPNQGNSGALIVQDASGNVITMTNGRVVIHSKGALEIRSDGEMTLQGRLVKRLGGPI
jgi:uncharacterized protein involved in type VI secretion and phage assembly